MTDAEPSSRAGAPSPAIPSRPNSVIAAVLLEIPWECLALVVLLAISLCTGLSLAVHALWTRYSDHGSRAAAEARLSSSGDFRSYAAATDAVQCASVTRFIFERNGSVADAAIATFLCACVVLPHAVGLGGGFIALIYDRLSILSTYLSPMSFSAAIPLLKKK
ncbi:glutathione hydrolase 7-like [Dermacentor silvarum]|uniref:glutathione hydrolase 7-like n=1 Tax=Dermacentor silvarum TaxID=543639 RepID=UPI00210083E4|nr:glutathione hydrolase 7-like [Dermacentor silvarum]